MWEFMVQTSMRNFIKSFTKIAGVLASTSHWPPLLRFIAKSGHVAYGLVALDLGNHKNVMEWYSCCALLLLPACQHRTINRSILSNITVTYMFYDKILQLSIHELSCMAAFRNSSQLVQLTSRLWILLLWLSQLKVKVLKSWYWLSLS